MATLVLTTVGTMIGGPIGGTIGALIGQAVDGRLLAPKGLQGPRLSDLRVQTSSYGTPIPRLYGRMRVAGTVIWATDLVEHRHRQGGKGRPTTTSYSYSASFAVALSSRPVRTVGRIWAEGTIFRGAAGDFKSGCTFRLYNGDEDQAVDPLIAAAEGAGQCPAFRGIAYVVFEDMDLSPFGNRIPSLNFEVEADEGDSQALSLAGPLADVLSQTEAVATLPPIGGAVLSAQSRRAAIEPLARLAQVDRSLAGQGWLLGERADAPLLQLGQAASERGLARATRTLGDGGVMPRQIGLSVFDPLRDWQLGMQMTRVPGGLGPAETMGLPLAMEAPLAKALNARLARDAARQVRQSEWPGGFAALVAQPGAAVVTEDGVQGRVAERHIEGAGVRLTIETERSDGAGSMAADGGRVLASPDLLIGASRAWLFDLPLIDGMPSDAASRTVVAAAGQGPGWRQAAVSLAPAAAAPPELLGSIATMRVLGEVVTISGVGQPWLFDRAGSVTVTLLRDDMVLNNADDAAMLAGANLAVAGNEVFQFGRAEPLGARQWRLSHLLRGRWGTEDAMAEASAGRGFALLADPALLPLPALTQSGGHVLVEGQGDPQPLMLPIGRVGRSLRPLSPVHVVARWQGDGQLLLSWTRRSRAGSAWIDLIDTAMDEPTERYRVTVTPAQGDAMVRECFAASLMVDASTVANWRAVSGGESCLTVTIMQVGAVGLSPPLVAVVPL